MTLAELIRGKRPASPVATVTLATVATHQPLDSPTVAKVATVSVANPPKLRLVYSSRGPASTCGDCVKFEPDSINPDGGLGKCGVTGRLHGPGKGACADFTEGAGHG